MAVIVSTDSFVSVDDANTYADEHFREDDLIDWQAADDLRDATLREATQFIEANFSENFVGSIQTTTQKLSWPRVGAVDKSGRTLNGIPSVVEDATVELALAAIAGKLVPNETRGGKVRREKVDVIEIEYFKNAPAGTTYSWAESLLRPVLHNTGSTKRLFRV